MLTTYIANRRTLVFSTDPDLPGCPTIEATSGTAALAQATPRCRWRR